MKNSKLKQYIEIDKEYRNFKSILNLIKKHTDLGYKIGYVSVDTLGAEYRLHIEFYL